MLITIQSKLKKITKSLGIDFQIDAYQFDCDVSVNRGYYTNLKLK
jgi:hypothetical protein